MPRLVERLIDPVVGLAAEAHAYRKSKSHSPSPQLPSHQPTQPLSSNPSASPAGPLEPGPIDPNDPDIESDTEQWELDDEAQALAEEQTSAPSVPKGNLAGPVSIERLVSAFVAKHPPDDSNASPGSRLPYPVILSQRRPANHGRGFVRAYAPLLDEVGIDEATWMDFLESFDESIKVCMEVEREQGCGIIVL